MPKRPAPKRPRIKVVDPFLEYRCLEFDLIFVYKICYELVNIPINEVFEFVDTHYCLRRHKLCLKPKYHPKHESSRHFFSHHIVSVWNSLPELVVVSTSLAGFKARLNKFDLHLF